MRFVAAFLACTTLLHLATPCCAEGRQSRLPLLSTFAEDVTFAAIDSPCDDPQYVVLKTKPIDQMSAREYEYFQQKDRECGEFRRLQLEKGSQPGRSTAVSETPKMSTGTAVVVGVLVTCGVLLLISALASSGSSTN